MNDWYNDPPEEPEVPECCNTEMEVLDTGDCLCSVCGSLSPAPRDPECLPDGLEWILGPQCGVVCHHGVEGVCEDCLVEGDLRFDSERDKR